MVHLMEKFNSMLKSFLKVISLLQYLSLTALTLPKYQFHRDHHLVFLACRTHQYSSGSELAHLLCSLLQFWAGVDEPTAQILFLDWMGYFTCLFLTMPFLLCASQAGLFPALPPPKWILFQYSWNWPFFWSTCHHVTLKVILPTCVV